MSFQQITYQNLLRYLGAVLDQSLTLRSKVKQFAAKIRRLFYVSPLRFPHVPEKLIKYFALLLVYHIGSKHLPSFFLASYRRISY